MKNFLRTFFVAAFAVFLVAGANVPSQAARARPTRFDGRWSVVIYTLYGDCDRALRYSVRIVDGRVVADNASYQLGGRVSPNGAIRVGVAEGGQSAAGSGWLRGNTGAGQWRTSTGKCAGRWTAERRAANF